MTLDEVFQELDAAARANLSGRGVRAYECRKRELLAANHSAEDVDAILRGWIWDESEAESQDGSDCE